MPKITLLLHNIRSTHNVGSIFRTAEGFGVSEIIMSGYTPYPKIARDPRLPHIVEKLHGQIRKTALGAEELVPFRYVEDVTAFLDSYQHPVIALEQTPDSSPLQAFTPPDEFALIFGEEVHGITPELLKRAHRTVEIPMHGQKESFNVSVAAGIALYALTHTRAI